MFDSVLNTPLSVQRGFSATHIWMTPLSLNFHVKIALERSWMFFMVYKEIEVRPDDLHNIGFTLNPLMPDGNKKVTHT